MLMDIRKAFPSIEKPPPAGVSINHQCIMCGKTFTLEVEADCPEDWLSQLLPITGCNECAQALKRFQRSSEGQNQARMALGRKKQALRSAKRDSTSPDYRTRSDALDEMARLDIEIHELQKTLNALLDSEEAAAAKIKEWQS